MPQLEEYLGCLGVTNIANDRPSADKTQTEEKSLLRESKLTFRTTSDTHGTVQK